MRTGLATLLIVVVTIAAIAFVIDITADPCSTWYKKDITIAEISVAEDNITFILRDTTGEQYTYDLVSTSETLYRQGYECHTGTCNLMATAPDQGEQYHIIYDCMNRIKYIDQKV